MVAIVRVFLLVVGLLAYAVAGVGLARHANDEDHRPKPTSLDDKQPGAKRNRVDQEADPALDYLNEDLVESRGRVVVSPDHVTRSRK